MFLCLLRLQKYEQIVGKSRKWKNNTHFHTFVHMASAGLTHLLRPATKAGVTCFLKSA